jgi:hypothetical protein
MLAPIPCQLGRHSRKTAGRTEKKSNYVLIDERITRPRASGPRRHAQPRPSGPRSRSARLSVRNPAWPATPRSRPPAAYGSRAAYEWTTFGAFDVLDKTKAKAATSLAARPPPAQRLGGGHDYANDGRGGPSADGPACPDHCVPARASRANPLASNGPAYWFVSAGPSDTNSLPMAW